MREYDENCAWGAESGIVPMHAGALCHSDHDHHCFDNDDNDFATDDDAQPGFLSESHNAL